jgi:hypothetical protein
MDMPSYKKGRIEFSLRLVRSPRPSSAPRVGLETGLERSQKLLRNRLPSIDAFYCDLDSIARLRTLCSRPPYLNAVAPTATHSRVDEIQTFLDARCAFSALRLPAQDRSPLALGPSPLDCVDRHRQLLLGPGALVGYAPSSALELAALDTAWAVSGPSTDVASAYRSPDFRDPVRECYQDLLDRLLGLLRRRGHRRRWPDPDLATLEAAEVSLRDWAGDEQMSVADVMKLLGLEKLTVREFTHGKYVQGMKPKRSPWQLPRTRPAGQNRRDPLTCRFVSYRSWAVRDVRRAVGGWLEKLQTRKSHNRKRRTLE